MVDRSDKQPSKTSLRLTKNRIRRENKIERLAREYENVPIDEIERWTNEDEDDLEFRKGQQEFFLNDLARDSNVPLQVTGTRWYHSERRIGRIWRSIHRNNISDGVDTILVFRNGDEAVYRLSVGRDKADGALRLAISQGCTISKILVNYQEVF